MGGITGFLDHSNRLIEQDLLNASATLRHRGGSGNGIIFEKKDQYTLGIANERLATIDTTARGAQPLTSSCGNYAITFNGTIYNYLELRETLIKYGVAFSTLTDTEVILESYKKWGNSAFEKFDGSFAFVIFDKDVNQLIVARDELGTKPLYFYKTTGFYAFASEIRALLSYPTIEKKVNQNAIATYFRHGFFLGDETIYEGIFKAKKGAITIVDIHSGNSYDMPLKRNPVNHNLPVDHNETELQILNKIEEFLTETILKRNVADVPVGVLLSGGYDNAAIAAILQKNQTKRIKTYTVGIEGNSANDTKQAKKIAAHLKTNHHEFFLSKLEAMQIVKNLPNVFEEPMGNSGAIPLLFIGEKANKDVKILLNAEGGDELFGGIRTYAKAIKFNKLAELKTSVALKRLIYHLLKKLNAKTKAIIAADGLLQKYIEINACFTTEQVEKLVNTTYQPVIKANHAAALSIKDLLMYDLRNLLPNDILYKSDKCLMQFGIENREALLKTALIDYLKTLDPEWFIKGGEQKYLLKKIIHKYIPAHLMGKPKGGFVVPLASWLKTTLKPLVDQYINADKLNEHQLLNVAEVLKIKAAFNRNSSSYNAQKVWLILQFQMWHEKWIKAK